MNGPTHYRKAEQYLADAEKSGSERKPILAALAQGHALLALAAATVDVAPARQDPPWTRSGDAPDWSDAMTGEPEPKEGGKGGAFFL